MGLLWLCFLIHDKRRPFLSIGSNCSSLLGHMPAGIKISEFNAFLANVKEAASAKQPLKRGRPDAGQPNVQSVEEPKKRRGRPRK